MRFYTCPDDSADRPETARLTIATSTTKPPSPPRITAASPSGYLKPFTKAVGLQPAIPRRVAPQQSPLPLHQSPTIIAQFQSSEPTKIPLLNFTAGYRQTRAPQALAKDGPKGRDRLRHSNRNPETKRLIASARQGAIGVIYPNLPWLMRFNSRPINAGRYLIGWRGLSESLRRRICGCALLP
jgi:hypothetical protein